LKNKKIQKKKMEEKNFEKYSKNEYMEILLKALEMEEKDIDKIFNIFIFGSIVFKTSNKNSGKNIKKKKDSNKKERKSFSLFFFFVILLIQKGTLRLTIPLFILLKKK
jgi:hypothetical protein